MRLASYVPGELIPLPLSGSIRNYPMLQKSLWRDKRNFLEPLTRFASGDVRDHIASSKIDQEPPWWP